MRVILLFCFGLTVGCANTPKNPKDSHQFPRIMKTLIIKPPSKRQPAQEATSSQPSTEGLASSGSNSSGFLRKEAMSTVGPDSPYQVNETTSENQWCELRARQNDELNQGPDLQLHIDHSLTPKPPSLADGYAYGWSHDYLPMQSYSEEYDNSQFSYQNGVYTSITPAPGEGSEAYQRIRFYFDPNFNEFTHAVIEVRRGGPPSKRFEDRAPVYLFSCSNLEISAL